ncbi:NDP-hexose 2,3-dehydratase family protein [Thalassovita sp.]|uniref:NDP-hexose 2,3-dehydratase family protein n=1 Tax=Thalassovita sp. TaxID=1979401 RepID=UPI002B27BF23|nr:NDP-hexose 2,3-dehydratase family protein [Thalassovita sp.]
MPIVEGISHLNDVLEVERSGFSIRSVGFSEADDWIMNSGALAHRSGGFFNIVGVREPCHPDRVFLHQPQAAITGMITAVKDGSRYFLLQARAEPGNPNAVQFSPTVQATAANYMGLHGGAPTPYIDAFLRYDADATVLADTSQLDLGERYLFKTKRAIILEMPTLDPPAPSFVWVKNSVLVQAAHRGLFLNPDLRTLLALSPWSRDDISKELTPVDCEVRKSLSTPLRPEVLGRTFARTPADAKTLKFVPLEQLDGWHFDQNTFYENSSRQGIGVEMFETRAVNREVKSWSQPLIKAAGEGQAILVFRKTSSGLEFFASFAKETGLASPSALGPSLVQYPGSSACAPKSLSESSYKVVFEALESDEGGRFYRNIWRYRIAEYANDAKDLSEEQGVWLRLSELKRLLETSNICTIQLRAILSHLLAIRISTNQEEEAL